MRTIEAQYTLTQTELEAIMAAYDAQITPNPNINSYKTHTLKNTSKEMLERALGFPANVQDDPDKVEYSWGFEVNGVPCAIWDWKGSHEVGIWSVYDPQGVLEILFDPMNIEKN